MPDLPLSVDGLTKAQHRAHHQALHAFFNDFIVGPFTITSDLDDIDTGVELFTPEIGDTIVGLWSEPLSAWSTVGDQLGLGIAGTLDADLAFKFNLPITAPTTYPSFGRASGDGFPMFTKTERLLSGEPILARTVLGGNTTGSMKLRLCVLPATLF